MTHVVTDTEAPVEIYTINGVRVNNSKQKGLYIIKQGGKAKKMFVK